MPCPGLQCCTGLYCLTGLMCLPLCTPIIPICKSDISRRLARLTLPRVWGEWSHNAVTEPRGGGGTIACYDEINLTELQVLILTRYVSLSLGL